MQRISPLAARATKVANGAASVRSVSWLTPAIALWGCGGVADGSVAGVTDATRLPSPWPRTSWYSWASRETGWPVGQRYSRPALGGPRGATGVRRLRPPPGSSARARGGQQV
eukprot:6078013-Pleurochrysis_carterae.AAC.1